MIAVRDQALDGHALGALISNHDFTVMQGTPSTSYQLLGFGWNGEQGVRSRCDGDRGRRSSSMGGTFTMEMLATIYTGAIRDEQAHGP
jgi:hypothetical protein